ncbi:homing endonuclease associated repeat-containing protein [Planctomicrobium piriforme]|uniref:Uncharacterized protein n=1 Tax=Planctomicrobium piriforme TaxID=1576369 RepID=A0A1I3ELG3_9PLAN|nr:hypothetical protein [Planctomicrobium piriforme]SFH99551.1 hypothetical protein SAMN05421753_104267 [Planctomicrobium piriforme]
MTSKSQLTHRLVEYVEVFGYDISLEFFQQLTGCTQAEIAQHWGSWDELRQSAELASQSGTASRPSPHLTREEILELLRQAVAAHGSNISLQQFRSTTGLSERIIVSRFGRWSELRTAAGLKPYAKVTARYSDRTLLADLHRIAKKLGRLPKRVEYESQGGKFSGFTFHKRFGPWPSVLTAYKKRYQRPTPTR